MSGRQHLRRKRFTLGGRRENLRKLLQPGGRRRQAACTRVCSVLSRGQSSTLTCTHGTIQSQRKPSLRHAHPWRAHSSISSQVRAVLPSKNPFDDHFLSTYRTPDPRVVVVSLSVIYKRYRRSVEVEMCSEKSGPALTGTRPQRLPPPPLLKSSKETQGESSEAPDCRTCARPG